MMPSNTRTEWDAFGPVQIPADRLWGAQTQRALALFGEGPERFPVALLHSFGLQKLAAVRANRRLGVMPEPLAALIETAAQTLYREDMRAHFPLCVWQTGSGTQTNMNANEVIANLANQLAGQAPGTRSPVHPNNHVNASQSSNDSFPTVMHLCTVLELQARLIPALTTMQTSLEGRAHAFRDTLKLARTHLMDAVPTTLGSNFRAYAQQIAHCTQRVTHVMQELYLLPQGGTAAGTGLNAPAGFDVVFCEEVRHLTGLPFVPNPSKEEGMAAHDALVQTSATLAGIATALTKIANDIRLMGSGPRGGLNELQIPHDGLTSSIMPGKRNPTIAEVVVQIAQQVLGNHHTISLAGASGSFELNVAKPVLIHNLLQSIRLLADGLHLFSGHLVDGLAPNQEQLRANLENSLMAVTALAPTIGYDKAAEITAFALSENLSPRAAAVALGHLSVENYDALVDFQKLAMPHR